MISVISKQGVCAVIVLERRLENEAMEAFGRHRLTTVNKMGMADPAALSVDQFMSNSKSSNPKQNSCMGPYKIPASFSGTPIADHENRESSAAVLISRKLCC